MTTNRQSIKNLHSKNNLPAELEHSIVPVSINPKTSDYIRKVVVDVANQLPGLPLSKQVSIARNAMREIMAESVVLDYAFSRLSKGQSDAVFVEGLPIFEGDLSANLCRTMSMIVGSPIGLPMQYEQQNGGDLIAAIKPDPDSVPDSQKTSAHFGSHTDDAYVPYEFRVLCIALLGEINESRAETGYSPIDKIVKQLSKCEIAILEKPLFEFREPASLNGGKQSNTWSEPRPILFRLPSDALGVQSPTYNTRITTVEASVYCEAEAAFGAFRIAVENAMRWFVVEPGTYLVFRNDRGLHSRKKIKENTPRCVHRMYWRNNLDAMRSASETNGYIFDLDALIFGDAA